jgi:hypothetical protein
MAGGSSPEIPNESKSLRRIEDLDLLSKLRQGYMVTDNEKETLLSLAACLEDEAEAVDPGILGFIDSRDKLCKAAEQARSLVAPIRRLPPEILVEIFLLTYSTIHFRHNRRLKQQVGDCGVPMILAGKICSS